VISALSRSPGASACSRSNSLIVDNTSPSHTKVSPTNSLTVGARHLSPPPASVRYNSFLSVDYGNHHHHHFIRYDTNSVVTSPPNGLASSEDGSRLPFRSRCRFASSLLPKPWGMGTPLRIITDRCISKLHCLTF